MSEAAEKLEDWIEGWLREQRKKLGPDSGDRESQPEDSHEAGSGPSADPWAGLRSMWAQFDVLRTTNSGAFGPFGLAREEEKLWRELAAAQARYSKAQAHFFALIHRVQLDALDLLEKRIRERAATEPVRDVREIYDLWIECGEQVYAKCAHSDAYCQTQAAFANATSELRTKQQAVIERGLKLFDLPTRAELNGVHRQLRELNEKLERSKLGHGRSKSGASERPRVKPAAKQGVAKRRRSPTHARGPARAKKR